MSVSASQPSRVLLPSLALGRDGLGRLEYVGARLVIETLSLVEEIDLGAVQIDFRWGGLSPTASGLGELPGRSIVAGKAGENFFSRET